MIFYAHFYSLNSSEHNTRKHYAYDADELKRYHLFKKSKANVAKLNEFNPESVFGIWINRVINETTFETHCEATGYFPPVRQYRNVDDCRVHTCGPHGTCVNGVSSHSCYCDSGFQEAEIDRVKFDFTHTANTQNVSYSLKVNEFADLDNQRVCVPDEIADTLVVQKLENTVFVYVPCPGAQGDKPNNVWSGLKHLRIPEHGKCSDPWSEL